ncbi:MAG: biotin--[acetyl-CoA-carboxylase] ligase [Gemella sp.]|nr:biotin--[acetyl-CoA-carboxylase] ligase [Gemella sp.]
MVISKEQLQNNLNAKYTFELVESLDSTMDYIKKYADEKKYNHIVISREQVAGRGRNGKEFLSQKDTGLYMSVLIKPNFSYEELLKVSILTSTAVYSAVKELYGIDLELKWVNDLILGDKKVGGILCESSITTNNELEYVIIGLGLNTKKQEFTPDLVDIASSIENLRDVEIEEGLLAAKIIDYLDKYLEDDSKYLELYKKVSNIIGKEIDVHINNESFSAVAILINKYGHLLVDKSGEMIPLTSGEVSIRKK